MNRITALIAGPIDTLILMFRCEWFFITALQCCFFFFSWAESGLGVTPHVSGSEACEIDDYKMGVEAASAPTRVQLIDDPERTIPQGRSHKIAKNVCISCPTQTSDGDVFENISCCWMRLVHVHVLLAG